MITLIIALSSIMLGVGGFFGGALVKDAFDMRDPGQAIGGLLLSILCFALCGGLCWVMAVLV